MRHLHGSDRISRGEILKKPACRAWRFFSLNPVLLAVVPLVIQIFLAAPGLPELPFDPGSILEIEGWVSSAPSPRGNRIHFELKPTSIRRKGRRIPILQRIAVWLPAPPSEEFGELQYGDRLSFTTFLRPPTFHVVPGVSDRRLTAWRLGVPVSASLKSSLQLERKGVVGKWWVRLIRHVHRHANQSWDSFEPHLNAFNRQVLPAALLGRKSQTSLEVRKRFQDLGLSHLLVVSGFHVGLVMFIVHLIVSPLPRILRLVVPLAGWLYIALAGFPHSAARAGVIASLFYTGKLLHIRANLANSLGIAALVLLGLYPSALFLPGFQLSFACLLAIAVLGLPLSRIIRTACQGLADLWTPTIILQTTSASHLRRKIRFQVESWLEFMPESVMRQIVRRSAAPIRWIFITLAIGFSIQLVTLPLVVFHFHQWNWSATLNNLVAMPLFSLLIAASWPLFFIPDQRLGLWLCSILNPIAGLMEQILELLAQVNLVTFGNSIDLTRITIYYLLLTALLMGLPFRKRILVMILPLLLFLSSAGGREDSNSLVVTFLDVGQGDAIHLRYPDGRDSMLDTGGSPFEESNYMLGRRVVAPYLWQARVRRLEFLMISHPESDHQGAYSTLRRLVPIRHLLYFMPRLEYPEASLRVQQGIDFEVGGVSHHLLHPSPFPIPNGPNEASIVMTLRYGRFSMLLTGDIPRKVERNILSKLEPVTLLKLPHHGSRSSSSRVFLAAVRPAAAMVSVGRRNPFGHPHPDVIERVEELGIELYSTARHGSIRVRTDGKAWSISAYDLEEHRFKVLRGPSPLPAPGPAGED